MCSVKILSGVRLTKCILLILVLSPGVLFALEQPAHRYSLAISGGASKGAYEAGLNWGIVKYLQRLSKVRPATGGEFRKVKFSSFSGASAGAINTLLSSLTWCAKDEENGGPLNQIQSNLFKDLWTMPDVNRLLPPQVDSVYYTADDALLSRHDLLHASRMLRERWNQPVHRQGCRIPIGVAVTRVEPELLEVSRVEVQNQRFYIIFEARTKPDGRLGFFWNTDHYPGLIDPSFLSMPSSSPDSGEIDEQFIEDAILSSSAYPGGFGRKSLQYCRRTIYKPEDKDPGDEHEKSHMGKKLYCPDDFELTEAVFADGGLFDNLPIGLARTLAEESMAARKSPLPVTYLYMDPDRQRYESPEPERNTACDSEHPPQACQTLDYSILSEYGLMLGALGTARKFELYRELTSEHWAFNIVEMSNQLALELEKRQSDLRCAKEFPIFDQALECKNSLKRAADLLELGYIYQSIPIHTPFSVNRLQKYNLVSDCKKVDAEAYENKVVTCSLNLSLYRDFLNSAISTLAKRADLDDYEVTSRISRAASSPLYDRTLRISDRGAPITGTLLSSFGAFLDLKFRQYDYYVGVYDAAVSIAYAQCQLQYSIDTQPEEYRKCFTEMAKHAYGQLGVGQDTQGRYIFALLAQQEFGDSGVLGFSYNPMPAKDESMHAIFNSLEATIEAGDYSETAQKGLFYTEKTFFAHLKQEGFKPSQTEDGSTSLLQDIMDDPSEWASELTRRMTSRAVYLERQAKNLYAQREPDPEKRENSYVELLGATAYVSQVATYNAPEYTFSPSVAPEDWVWRNVIPYEVGVDLIEGDIGLTWQPTWAASKYNLVGVRGTLGFAGGVIRDPQTEDRGNYGSLGLDFTRRTYSSWVSSWGITPTFYHTWQEPETYDQDTIGGDLHVSFLRDRIRLGIGVRDYREASDTWFLNIGITDVPGMTYWLTR